MIINRSRSAIIATVLPLLLCAGCESRSQPAPGHVNQSHDINSWAAFGSSNVTEMAVACAGRVTLQQGAATVKDGCFTGETNVVLCTDVTAPNPVMCAPGKDGLSVAGTGADTISYARVR
jgi:hypothetical protein